MFPASAAKLLTALPVGLKLLPAMLQTLSDREIVSVASAFLGPKTHGLIPVLAQFRTAQNDGSDLEKVLETPEMAAFVKSLKDKTEDDNNRVFMKCPLCEQNFETDLVAQAG